MIKPAGHRILVKPDPIRDRTSGGLFVPEQARDRQMVEQIFGTIVDVGPNAWKAFDDGRPWAVIGDRVAFAKYGGFVIQDPDTNEVYRLLNDEDVAAVLSKEESQQWECPITINDGSE